MSEIRTAGPRGWARALALTMMIATWAPAAGAGDEAAGPAWLRTPLTRGPVAATLGLDEQRHLWWGFDGVVPLSFGTARLRTHDVHRPLVGLGLSITGQGGSDAQGLRYTTLLDRREPRKGAWLGFSTGGVNQGQTSRLHVGTGLWRAISPVEVEAGVVSSFVEFKQLEANHWGFWRDSLHWRDTTTYRYVDRSEMRVTGQSALRYRYRRVELSAVGGLTLGPFIAPHPWAQATLNVKASRRVLFMAAYGERPAASTAFEPSARPETMVGVQFAPWASQESEASPASAVRARAWVVRSLEDGRTLVQVRCRDASLVEIAADFTDWVPVPLTAVGGGKWETTLRIPPGLHEVQIRLDNGEWLVPPGLPSREREFAGPAGVLLVE